MKAELSGYFTFGFSLLQFLSLVAGIGLTLSLLYPLM